MPQSSLSARWLFWIPTLIWASTWHVILFQLDSSVPVFNSVAWRFGLASLMLFALARFRGERLALPASAHWLMLATGIVQYSGNYWGVYESERHIPSGLVAVLFCLMVFGNALSGSLFFGQQVTRRFLIASSGGVLGVVLIFWPEIASTGERPTAALGLAMGLAAVLAACVGNVLTLTLTRRSLPLVPILAWSMGYGSVFLVGLSLATGTGLHFDWSPRYLGSLLYLAVLGSVTAFIVYFKLAQREGAARAALTGVVIPVIALTISALFEGWRPTLLAVAGMLLCLSSVFVATRPARALASS
ncbi:DMT family transporter [Pelomonas sp. V22]|uniref:DMT family transporter n=1 Tax=Pelomonas sp. V22 TaxID=2822139 RepID=UPI0024A9283A|nr:DMT family transporter [Pelomonas sp. V22]MDI4634550.1 DMT family transporter [Pelomonas sp. V22]